MNYGIPYKGSKNTIAEDIVKCIPRGVKILDACCGGGAFLMAAAMSGRWKFVVGNDRNCATVDLLDAVLINKGQIEYNNPEVCTRDDFFNSLQRIENGEYTIQDCVNKFCASFGNDGKTYLYGSDIEEYKVTAERMLTAKTLEERRKSYRKFYSKFYSKCQEATRLHRLESLQRLQSLERLERLERLDIFDIDYSEFDIVYFDIPYRGTNKYDFEFDYERFYSLFDSLKIPAFLSEYEAPFTVVAKFDKAQNMAASVGSTGKKEGLERLYFNGKIEDYKKLMGREYRPMEEKQTDLFGE